MVHLRKRAKALYPLLNASKSNYAREAVRRLDKALNNTRGVIDRYDPKVKELVQACDFAETILG
ncbi:MAG: hypothetical protein ACWGQW_01615 [bacterium]